MKVITYRGFSVVSILLAIVAVGVLAGVGYYVYDKNTNDNASNDNQAISVSNEAAQQKYTYAIPSGWGELKCDTQDTETNPVYQILYPNYDKAVDCDDRDNVVLIGRVVYPVDEKCSTLEEVNKISEENGKTGYTSYECKEIVVNDVNVLVRTQSKPSDAGIFAIKTYDFDGTTKVYVNYYARASDGAFLDSDDVETLIDTVKIN